MNESETYITETARHWIWSGFYTEEDVQDMLEDILEEDADEGAMRAFIVAEFEKKDDAEADWPEVTDCDRLDAAFKTLDEEGVCALQNAGYTMSDGFTEVAEALHERGRENYFGFCFFHAQDTERAIDGQGLTIAFGDIDDNPARTMRVGEAVVAALHAVGFETAWDGTADNRIDIPKIDWKRRY